MSDTMDICGLKAERGQKLQTYIPVLDSNTKNTYHYHQRSK